MKTHSSKIAGQTTLTFAAMLSTVGLVLSPLSPSRADNAETCRGFSSHPQEACIQMVEMEVRDVVPIREVNAHAIVLVSKKDGTLLPVFVEEADALSIAFHLAHHPRPQALPHDLLGEAINGLGGTVTEVRLDSVQGHNYAGWVFISQGPRQLELKGYPAEIISLALTRHSKIYVSRKLLGEAGISRDEVDRLKKRDGQPQDNRPGVGGSGPPVQKPQGASTPQIQL